MIRKGKTKFRAITFAILTLLSIRDVIASFIEADLINRVFIVVGFSFFMMILSVIIENQVSMSLLKKLYKVRWINTSRSLKVNSLIIRTVICVGVIFGLYALLSGAYLLLLVSSMMIIIYHMFTLYNSKILLASQIVVINGFAMHIDKINEVKVQITELLKVTVFIEEKGIHFIFKKDKMNIQAFKEIQERIDNKTAFNETVL